MNKAGLRSWAEQNREAGEEIVWAGSPRMVYFRGLFIARVIPGIILLGLATWFYYGAPGIPLPEWALFLTDTFPKELVFALGVLFVALPFVRAYMLRHTFYIITNLRVLKARVLSNRVRQIPIETVARARRIDYHDGLCSYIFDVWEDGPPPPRARDPRYLFRAPGFQGSTEESPEGMNTPPVPAVLKFWRNF